MKSVGQGVREIRVHTGDGAYRVIYVVKFEGVVHVLHAFVKKSQKTEQRELDKAKRAYADLVRSATR
jgi:phage-related protein